MNTIKVRADQAEKAFNNAKKQVIAEPNRTKYYYELGNAYLDTKRYEEAYKYYNRIRGYEDVDTIIKSIARYIPNVDTNPGMKTVIQELSNVRTAQEMIEKLRTIGLSSTSMVYKQIMEVLERRAKVERLYGVNHERTILELKSIEMQ